MFFFFFKFLQYRLYGEPVVKACIENGTSCIDISGEPQVWKMKKKKTPILLVFCWSGKYLLQFCRRILEGADSSLVLRDGIPLIAWTRVWWQGLRFCFLEFFLHCSLIYFKSFVYSMCWFLQWLHAVNWIKIAYCNSWNLIFVTFIMNSLFQSRHLYIAEK